MWGKAMNSSYNSTKLSQVTASLFRHFSQCIAVQLNMQKYCPEKKKLGLSLKRFVFLWVIKYKGLFLTPLEMIRRCFFWSLKLIVTYK